jgi:hypothetical protein
VGHLRLRKFHTPMRDAPAGPTAAGKWQCGLAASHEDVTGGIMAVGGAILIGAATKP